MIEVRLLKAQDVLAAAAAFTAIYRAAFGPPPYRSTEAEVRMFRRYLPRHAGREGFLCAAAYDATTEQWVGMAYGYTSRPGQWWHDQITPKLAPAQVQQWFTNSFEWVELAVIPEYQGHGLGKLLHDTLLGIIPNPCAVLSTIQVETPAYHLYQQRGWQIICRNFHFESTPHPFLIMGLQLHPDAAATSGEHA